MKICPQCRTTYDDSNNFCLNDGTALLLFDGEPQTVVRNDHPSLTNQSVNSYGQSNYGQTGNSPKPPKSNSTVLYLLTALVLLLLGAVIVAGVYIFTNNKNQVAQNNSNIANANSVNKNTVSNVSNNSSNAPAKNANINTNVNKLLNANINANVAPSPSASPLSASQLDDAKNEVSDTIDSWKSASEEQNINAHLNNYADTVNYYNGGNVPVSKVRADKEKAFSAYNSIEITLSNEVITPNATGDKATAVFDKEWNFSNDEKTSSGKVKQQLTLEKNGGRWRITGEKDLSVYYKNS